MRDILPSPSPKAFPGAANGKPGKPAPRTAPSGKARVSGVYESAHPAPASESPEIRAMLADIISRLNRIEEKIDENVYPPESAIRPDFIRQVKKAESDIRKGKAKTYKSMDAFIRTITE